MLLPLVELEELPTGEAELREARERGEVEEGGTIAPD